MDVRDDDMKGQDSQETHSLSSSKEATPPSDGTEPRVSRKREREVSLEPATPQAASSDIESSTSEIKDRRVPTKKNRISAQLDVTQEEEENGENAGQGMSCSPPTESKIRQISQGVEDLTWKNMVKPATPDIVQTVPADSTEHAPMDTEQTGPTAPSEREPVLPFHMRGENTPMTNDEAGEDEHAGEADPKEVPPDAQPPVKEATPLSAAAEHEDPALPPTPGVTPPVTAALSRRASDESIEHDKGMKRKMGDRTVSERRVPEDLQAGDATAKHAIAAKRPRDDDEDANPRLTKRPTPPPDEEQKAEGASQTQAEMQTQSSSQSESRSSSFSSTFTTRPSGFLSYASTSSPFASVTGPSLFASKTWGQLDSSTSGFSSANTGPNAIASPTPLLGSSTFPSAAFGSTPSKEHGLKRTGFQAFASSSSSPFGTAAKRSKSPPPASANVFARRSGSPARHHSPARANVSAFSAYASGGAHGFTTSARKRAGSPALGENGSSADIQNGSSQKEEDEESKDTSSEGEKEKEKQVSFGERLRSQKDEDDVSDEEKKLELTEQEVHTGEEDEETVYQVRGKLFALSSQNQWKERGTGQLKLNVRREDGSSARLLMRKEAVYTVLLNATLFRGMKCFIAQDPRYIRFSMFENGVATHYNIRVSSAKIASELLEEINSHIP